MFHSLFEGKRRFPAERLQPIGLLHRARHGRITLFLRVVGQFKAHPHARDPRQRLRVFANRAHGIAIGHIVGAARFAV